MTFPDMLFGFLECEEFRDTIWWNADGDAFGIEPQGFTEKVLKKHCEGMKFESFRKNLNRFGFKKYIGMWRHDMFQRGKPELLQKIKNVKKAEVSSREHLQVAGNVENGEVGSREHLQVTVNAKKAEVSSRDHMQVAVNTKKAEVSYREHLQVADNAPTYRTGEDSSPPMSSRHGLLQSNQLDQQLPQQSCFASEGPQLLSLRDSHIVPSRFVPYRAVADHQHQVYPFRSAADLLAEHRLHRLRQEQVEVRLLEVQKERYAAETNLRLLEVQKEQELARFAHFSHISNSSPAHLALHSHRDVSRVPYGVLGVQCVMQLPMVNPAPSNRLLNNASRTVAQTAAQTTNQVGYSEGLVVLAPTHVAMHNDTVSSENLSSVPVVCASSQSSTGKRSRQVSEQVASDEDSDEDSKNDCAEKRQLTVDGKSGDSTTKKGRTGKWEDNFHELMRYRQRTGDCLVPYRGKENPTLARWVKRQRYQYRKKIEGRPSAMTEERVKILEEAGFIWDLHAAVWEERLEELKAFRKTHRHCNVSAIYSENIKLREWVKCQRRQYTLLKGGKKSNLSTQRVHDLESIGFEWQLRRFSC
jgi:hypothetical protein